MCDAQCQNPLGPGRSLFTLQSSEDDDRRGSDAPLRIITPPPDTQRHFKSTQPPPPPLLLSSHWSKEEITVSLSLSLLTSSLFHTHRKEKHSHTVRWPGRGSTSLNKTGLIIPSSLFLLLLLLFLPPPLQLFTEVAPTASQISIYITSALSLLGQLHSRNAGPTGSSAPCVVEGRASAM